MAGLALLSAQVASAPVRHRQVTCYSGVYMVIARGSNEDPGEGRPSLVADLVAAAIPGSGRVAVDYPATITGPLYPTSVTDGIKDAIEKIESYIDTCGSSSRVVLIGYSQGGNVVTDVLAGGVAKPDPITPAYAQYGMFCHVTRHKTSPLIFRSHCHHCVRRPDILRQPVLQRRHVYERWGKSILSTDPQRVID